MIQNIIIAIIIIASAWFIGKRFYNNLNNPRKGSGCGCGCSGCEPDTASTCQTSGNNPDN